MGNKGIKCECRYDLGMGPNLNCPIHGEENSKRLLKSTANGGAEVPCNVGLCCANTDKEIWRETEDDYYAPSGVMRDCYDCLEENKYEDSDIYEYYDAEQGNVSAFTCKSCGLTNQVNA